MGDPDRMSLESPVARVLVVGPSMVPALHHGDQVIVVRGLSVRPGDVVVARFDSRPDLLVVKRAVRPCGHGTWWVEGDSSVVADDSRRYGPAVVTGRVVWRYWPPLRRR